MRNFLIQETSSWSLSLKNHSCNIKASVSTLVMIYFGRRRSGHTIKTNLITFSDCWSRDMLNFGFLWKDPGLTSPTHFEYNFSWKIFFMLYSNNWPNFIAWLHLLLKILGNICIGIFHSPVCGAIDLKTSLGFITKPFSYMIKKILKKIISEGEILTWNEKNFSLFLKACNWN